MTASGTDAADRFGVGDAGGKLLLDGPGPDVQVTAAEAQDHARVAGLGEADIITSDSRVPGPGQVDIDGGDGADRAITRGTDGDDEIGIARNGTDVVATFATGFGVVNHVAVESLTVQGLAGADRLAGLNGIGALTALTLDGGEGADDLRGGDGADTLLGGNGDDHVDGNLGADTARLGAGDDRFQWDPGDASDTVEGQTGADALDFNASNAGEQIDVSRNGGRVRVTRNIGTVTMDVNDVEASFFRLLGGSDQIAVGDLSGTDLKSADIDLSATIGGGDSSQDTVTVNGRELADTVDVTASGQQVLVDGPPRPHPDQRQREPQRHAAAQHARRQGSGHDRSRRGARDHAGHRPRHRPVATLAPGAPRRKGPRRLADEAPEQVDGVDVRVQQVLHGDPLHAGALVVAEALGDLLGCADQPVVAPRLE